MKMNNKGLRMAGMGSDECIGILLNKTNTKQAEQSDFGESRA